MILHRGIALKNLNMVCKFYIMTALFNYTQLCCTSYTKQQEETVNKTTELLMSLSLYWKTKEQSYSI